MRKHRGSKTASQQGKAQQTAKLFMQAFEFHKAGEQDKAEALYEEVLERQPGYVNALLNLGAIRRAQRRQGEAIELY